MCIYIYIHTYLDITVDWRYIIRIITGEIGCRMLFCSTVYLFFSATRNLGLTQLLWPYILTILN